MNEFKTVNDIPDDLRWLAENVDTSEWGDQHFYIQKQPGGWAITACAYQLLSDENYYHRDEYFSARDLISGKPSWDDAPEWAELVAQDNDGVWWWFEIKPQVFGLKWTEQSVNGKMQYAGKGYVISDWRNTLYKRHERTQEPVEDKPHGYLSVHINALSRALPYGVSLTVGINPGYANLHDGVTDYRAPVDEAGDMVETWLKLNKWEVK